MDNSQKKDILRYAELSCREQLRKAEQRPQEPESVEEMRRLLASLNMSHEQIIDLAVKNVMEETE